MNADDTRGGFRDGELPLLGAEDRRRSADDVDRFLVEERIDQAVVERRRERWMRQQLSEALTVPGLLLGAVGIQITVGLITGSTLGGRVEWVGRDVAELSTRKGRCWVALAAIVSVHSDVALPGAVGSGQHLRGSTLAEVLVDLVADRADIEVELTGGELIRGEITAVGQVISVSSDDIRLRYAASDAIVTVRMRS